MATYYFSVTTEYHHDDVNPIRRMRLNGALTNPDPNQASLTTVNPGDTLVFQWTSHTNYNGGIEQPPAIEFFGLDAGIYAENSSSHSIYLSAPGQSVTRTINSNPSTSIDTIRLWDTQSPEKWTRGYLKIQATAAQDVVPDAFSMGADRSGQPLSNYVYASSFTISGLSAGASATVYVSRSGSFAWSLNGGTWTSFATSNPPNVSNGDNLAVRCYTASTYNTTSWITLSIGDTGIGTTSDTWSVTTLSEPAPLGYVDVYASVNSEFGNIQVSQGSTSSNPVVIHRGYALRLHNNGSFGTISSNALPSSIWTNTSAVSVGVGGSASRTSRTDATITATTWTLSSPGYPNRTLYIDVRDTLDNTPDQFDLGSSLIDVPPGTYQYSAVATITGINTNLLAQISGGEMKVNNGNWTSSSQTVYNGAKVRVRVMSSTNYAITTSATLTINGVQAVFSARTYDQPPPGQVISIGISTGLIKLSQIRSFFGGVVSGLGNPPWNLTAYYRNGSLVPNLTVNNGIPTSGLIKLSHFYNSGTEFYISDYPDSKSASDSTLTGSKTIQCQWTVGTDWDVGWGNFAKQAAQYHYTLTVTNASGSGASTSDVVLERGYTGYNALNTYVRAKVTVPANSDRQYNGYITFYTRHSYDPTKVVSAKAYFFLSAHGP